MAQGKATVVQYKGESLTLAELSARCGIGAKTLLSRIVTYGKSVEEAVSTPIRKRSAFGGRPVAGVPRPVPKIKRHPSGRAYSRWRMAGTINERYFGKHGTAEANTAYRKFAADWVAGRYDQAAGAGDKSPGGLSVAALAQQWMEHVRDYYKKDGKPTTEVKTALAAARIVLDAGEGVLAADFTPAALRACRQALIDRGHARITINAYISRVVRMFAWGAGQSLVPPAVHGALKLVEHLKAGRTTAPDKPKKKPATDAQIEATIPVLAPADPVRNTKLAAMVRLQRLSGMRPGEVCAMEPGDLDRTADVWIYRVGAANKNRHRGKAQTYYLGPKAVAILRPFLEGNPAGPIFKEETNNYTHAVIRGSIRAGVPRWAPHQLRHALATEVAEKFRTLEHAAAAIGDTEAMASAVYIHVDPRERAKIEVARAMG